MSDFSTDVSGLGSWVHALARERQVFCPVPLGKANFRFEPVTARTRVALSPYRPTVVPPNKQLMPARDELLTFEKSADGGITLKPSTDETRRVLFGVRPCDLKAIALLDRLQRDGVPDRAYLARRERTTIVAVACVEPCDERCFCAVVGSLDHRDGADVVITPEGTTLLVEARTPAGEELVKAASLEPCADLAARRTAILDQRKTPFGRQLGIDVAKLPAILRKTYRAELWEQHVRRCFSCGSCTLVCPTCYCFDVKDDLNFDLQSGNRARTWDSCMLPEFAVVAGGHNFRPEAAARQRHRVKRKFEFLPERYGLGSFCVGCGRCGRQCTSGIDIFDITLDAITEGARS
jgi:sulfhydrogenase subunit beta (sulfur reductase)